jgi:glutaredoxin 3
MSARYELFGTSTCPYTRDMRDWLEMRRANFTEYDVEADATARQRLRELAGSQRTVPVHVENGEVTQIGWQGRACVIGE